MDKKTIRDVSVADQRVLVRADFNVPIKAGRITDDTRIKGSLLTIDYLRQEGARIILCSHLGRPKSDPLPKYSLKPVSIRLGELIGIRVRFVDDCIGQPVAEAVAQMATGDVILVENTRFYCAEESKNEAEMLAFAEQLAAPADMYVNDAFGTCHRKHASTYGVTKYLSPCVAGLLVEEEVDKLSQLLQTPQEGFVAILGGAKVEDKIGVIKALLPRVERLLIGGAMAWAFFKAQGMEIGESLCTDKSLAGAQDILSSMPNYLDRLVLPTDVHMKKVSDDSGEMKKVAADQIEPGWNALDIGPQTMKQYADIVLAAQTVFWNGPMGYFEEPPFDHGTLVVAKAMGECRGYNVIGGGDSVAAVTQMGLADEIDHVSTGGGASLKFIENNGSLPAVEALDQDV